MSSLHKIRFMQNFLFCGCSPFCQGCSTERIQGGVKACAVFRDSHLLGNIKQQQRACFSKKPPLWILQQRLPAGSPLPKSACGHQRGQRLKTVSQALSALECSEPGTPSAQELPDILDSCKVEFNHVGEGWPNLYIGNM